MIGDMTKHSRRLFPLLLLSMLPLCAAAAAVDGPAVAQPGSQARAGCLPEVSDAWLRSPPMPMPMMAGFARVVDPCGRAVAIVGARSDAFEKVELHETTVVDGVSRMRAVERIELPADGEVVFRPGGLHLMLMRPRSPLGEGEFAQVEFRLADGRTITAGFEVRAPDAR